MMPSPSSHDHVLRRSFSEQRSFPRSCNHSYRFYINLLITLFCVFLTLLQIQTVIRTSTAPFTFPSSYSAWPLLAHHVHNLIGELELRQRSTAEPRGNVTFLPLKDLRFAETAMVGNTWFMSSVNDTKEKGEAEYVYFPSKEMDGKLLCLGGGSASNGTMNSYALAPAEALPPNAKLLSGPTFVSDTFYSYDNIFHGISALAPFVAWHERKACVMPARWVLYQQGEIRRNLKSPWIRTLMEATFGPSMEIEQFRKSDEGPSCFEQAVVFRHNQGTMGRERKEKLYDLLRCNARAYCNITMEEDGLKAIRLTLLLRVGARSFKDDDAVIHIFRRECTKVEGCRLKIAHPNNLNFCDQVKLMSGTDILASPHGAQLTNMFFMDKNSSVMEFFPKGWLELAGVGQYVYRWLADWSGMRHQGAWNDPHGEPCPPGLTTSCFSFLKNQQLGHDEAFFSNWTARVLGETRRYKLQKPSTEAAQEREGHCKCG